MFLRVFSFILSGLVFCISCPTNSIALEPCNTRMSLYKDALRASDYSQKAKFYLQLVEKCPKFAEAHNNLADAFEHLGQYEKAITHYQLAAEANPNLYVAYFGQGDAYLKTGQYEKAIISYKKGLLFAPEDKLAKEGLKAAEQKLSLYREADIITSEKIIAELQDSPIILMGPGGVRQKETRVRFNNILFNLNSANLKPASTRQLQEVGRALSSQKLSTKSFIIEGHTDSTGNSEYNLQLSEDRALSVLNYLISKFSVDPNKFIAKGYGENRPLADNQIPSGRALNRRVEIVAVSN